jgi:integrase
VSIPRREIRLRHTKSGKERPAFINDLAMQVLISMGGGSQKHRGLLFPDVTPAQVTVAFIRACDDAGVSDFSLHDLRHHYASTLRMNGVDLHTLQKLLGHSDPRMTDRYAHLSLPFLLDAAKRLDSVLSLVPAAPELEAVKSA